MNETDRDQGVDILLVRVFLRRALYVVPRVPE
jgi:hypothetical protein